MRLLIPMITTAFIMLIPVLALAQTPVSKEQANTYFDSCVTNSAATEKRFSSESQQQFCACTAARLTQYFTIEDMQVMTSQTDPNARLAMNKMIVNIYAPCMETPVREYHYGQCLQNPQTAALGNPQKICGCAANAIATYLKQNGAQKFQEILSVNPNIYDPMQALYDDPTFQTYARTELMRCL